MNPQLEKIIRTPSPAFRANIRDLSRKEWAAHVRRLLKELQISGVSVTAPSYSMAQSIDIRLPDDLPEHEPIHMQLERLERAKHAPYRGMVQVCDYCRERRQARDAIERIILAAFPDLSDRSDLQSDYFDYCLSIN